MKKNLLTPSVKKKLKRLPYLLAEKSFWIFILLFSTSALLSFIFLYRPIKNQKVLLTNLEKVSVNFDEKIFQQVVGQWTARQEKNNAADQKSYPDVFSKREAVPSSSVPAPNATSSQTTANAGAATTTAGATTSEP